MADMFFEVAGISAPLWLPPLVAFVVSFFSSMVGVSGADGIGGGAIMAPVLVAVFGLAFQSVAGAILFETRPDWAWRSCWFRWPPPVFLATC